MTNKDIFAHVDHTLLSATATWEEIQKLCDQAVEFETASVCVPPCYVKRIKEKYGDLVNICTVIGFPLGYSLATAKAEETKAALDDGASEIDMVINITHLKNGEFDKILEEITLLKGIVGDNVLKVIIEACYLTTDEKIEMCQIVTQSGADYIKTSTGFGTGGATMEDILLFKKHIGENIKIKAAGGVKTQEDLEAFINAGCQRIGTSSAVKILSGETASNY